MFLYFVCARFIEDLQTEVLEIEISFANVFAANVCVLGDFAVAAAFVVVVVVAIVVVVLLLLFPD